MKREKISEIISLTDDRFLEEAAEAKQKHPRIIRYTAIAACLAAAVAATVMIGQSDFINPTPEIVTDALSDEAGYGDTPVQEIATAPAIYYEDTPDNEIGGEIDMAIVPKWEERKTPEKFTELVIGETSFSSQTTEIKAENIDTFISAAQMSGYDIYTDKTHTTDAGVYSIKNISSDCAVAVKIGDDDVYYAFVNVWYTPESLGTFIEALDLKNCVSFGKAYIDTYKYDELSTSYSQLIYADFDDSVIWDLLSDVTEAEYTEHDHPYDGISVETDIPLLGYENISFCVTTDGYIVTNILGTQKCFFAGAHKYDSLKKHLEEHVPCKEHHSVYEVAPDEIIPGKGNTGETTPGYNPDAPVVVPPYNPVEEVTSPPYYPGNTDSSHHSEHENTVTSHHLNPGTEPVPPTGSVSPQYSPAPPEIVIEVTTTIN